MLQRPFHAHQGQLPSVVRGSVLYTCKYSCHGKCEAQVVIPCCAQVHLEQVHLWDPRPLHELSLTELSAGTLATSLAVCVLSLNRECRDSF
ncbi:hypothetical protein MC885_003879, partial [Smutsia gigantea]